METQIYGDNVVSMTSPEATIKLENVVSEIEALDQEIDKINAQAKEDREPHESDKKAIKKRFKNEGGDIAALNVLLKNRKNERSLEAEQKDNYDQMCFKLEPKETLQ